MALFEEQSKVNGKWIQLHCHIRYPNCIYLYAQTTHRYRYGYISDLMRFAYRKLSLQNKFF